MQVTRSTFARRGGRRAAMFYAPLTQFLASFLLLTPPREAPRVSQGLALLVRNDRRRIFSLSLAYHWLIACLLLANHRLVAGSSLAYRWRIAVYQLLIAGLLLTYPYIISGKSLEYR